MISMTTREGGRGKVKEGGVYRLKGGMNQNQEQPWITSVLSLAMDPHQTVSSPIALLILLTHPEYLFNGLCGSHGYCDIKVK